MFPYVEIMRPANALMSSVAIFIGGLLVVGDGQVLGFPGIYLAMLIGFLITGGGNVINDYIDVDADRINRPGRAIPSGRISESAALGLSVFLFSAGIVLSLAVNIFVFAIALVNSLLLIVYSFDLQHRLLVGNLVVSYLVGSTFLFGGAAAGNPLLPLLLTIMAALANISREIVKDLEDVEGDRLGFLKKLASKSRASLAQRFGIKGKQMELKYSREAFLTIAAASMIAAIIVSPLPYLWNLLGPGYLFLLAPADLLFLASLYQMANARSKKAYHRASRTIKLGMLVSMLAFIAGILV